MKGWRWWIGDRSGVRRRQSVGWLTLTTGAGEPWPGEGRGHINLPRVRLNIYLFCTTKVATNKSRNTFFLYKYPFTFIFNFLKTRGLRTQNFSIFQNASKMKGGGEVMTLSTPSNRVGRAWWWWVVSVWSTAASPHPSDPLRYWSAARCSAGCSGCSLHAALQRCTPSRRGGREPALHASAASGTGALVH